MPCGSHFSNALFALGSNRDIHVLTGILAHSQDPSLNDILHECSDALKSLDIRAWETRKKALECVGQNLPQLLVSYFLFFCFTGSNCM